MENTRYGQCEIRTTGELVRVEWHGGYTDDMAVLGGYVLLDSKAWGRGVVALVEWSNGPEAWGLGRVIEALRPVARRLSTHWRYTVVSPDGEDSSTVALCSEHAQELHSECGSGDASWHSCGEAPAGATCHWCQPVCSRCHCEVRHVNTDGVCSDCIDEMIENGEL